MSLCINPQCPNSQNPNNLLFCQSCGSELLLQGRYRATRELGGGGFGKTYEITDQGISKVLKVLINNSAKAVELFQREAQVLSQLIHPGIPRVEPNGYFVFRPKNSQQPVHCLVMEKVEGENLWEYIKNRGRPIDGELATRWLTELVLILQQLHNQGILHRDIKPQNIILKPDGKLALIDFGAVREGTGTEVATAATGSGGGTEVATHAAGGTSISSTGYTPIEQINAQAVPQSDLFALGRTFIFLLTGREPTDKAMYDAFNDELKWRQYASGVSSQLAELIDHMTARLPRQRPTNAQAILQWLADIDRTLHSAKEVPNPKREAVSGFATNSSTSQASSQTSHASADTSSNTAQSTQSNLDLDQSARSPKNKKSWLFAGGWGSVVVASVLALRASLDFLSNNPEVNNQGKSTGSKLQQESCSVVVNGRLRTGPGNQGNQNFIRSASKEQLPITGRQSPGGWIEVKLSDARLAWAHRDIISNKQEMDSCLQTNGISIETVPDIPRLNIPASNSNPSSNTDVNSNTETGSSDNPTSDSNSLSDPGVDSNTDQLPPSSETVGEDPATMCDPNTEPC